MYDKERSLEAAECISQMAHLNLFLENRVQAEEWLSIALDIKSSHYDLTDKELVQAQRQFNHIKDMDT